MMASPAYSGFTRLSKASRAAVVTISLDGLDVEFVDDWARASNTNPKRTKKNAEGPLRDTGPSMAPSFPSIAARM